MNIELARQVLQPGWQVFEGYLRECREKHINALLNTTDNDESNLLKGRIKELDTLLRLTGQAKRFKEGKL